MIEVKLGRDLYSQQSEIYYWCVDHFGGMYGTSNNLLEENRWSVSMAFGYQHYTFKYLEDAVLFTLRWA